MNKPVSILVLQMILVTIGWLLILAVSLKIAAGVMLIVLSLAIDVDRERRAL